jgi:hypothetical protein
VEDGIGSAAMVSLAAKALDANKEAKKTPDRSELRIQKTSRTVAFHLNEKNSKSLF